MQPSRQHQLSGDEAATARQLQTLLQSGAGKRDVPSEIDDLVRDVRVSSSDLHGLNQHESSVDEEFGARHCVPVDQRREPSAVWRTVWSEQHKADGIRITEVQLLTCHERRKALLSCDVIWDGVLCFEV